jgi:hypothetical protein
MAKLIDLKINGIKTTLQVGDILSFYFSQKDAGKVTVMRGHHQIFFGEKDNLMIDGVDSDNYKAHVSVLKGDLSDAGVKIEKRHERINHDAIDFIVTEAPGE